MTSSEASGEALGMEGSRELDSRQDTKAPREITRERYEEVDLAIELGLLDFRVTRNENGEVVITIGPPLGPC